jgi:hypothetical protein
VVHTLGSAAAILIAVALVQEGVERPVCGVYVGGRFDAWQGRVPAFRSRVDSRVESKILFASRPAGNTKDETHDNNSE